MTLAAGALLLLFLGTRLGLSIRATGDNRDMVRASSINPTFTITVGLCIANALTALSGAMVGQSQKTADINCGTGIVVIGLACLIIGETVLGRGSVVTGRDRRGAGQRSSTGSSMPSCSIPRWSPIECLKLVTAVDCGAGHRRAQHLKTGRRFQRRGSGPAWTERRRG